jgi:hypothetical protein
MRRTVYRYCQFMGETYLFDPSEAVSQFRSAGAVCV